MRLRDRAAIVTGASSGIGRAITIRFASEGARVLLVDLQVGSRLETERPDTDAVIAAAGGDGRFVRADVSVAADVERAVAAAVEAFGGVDVLVNNAGLFIRHRIVEVADAEWEAILGVNPRGPRHPLRARAH